MPTTTYALARASCEDGCHAKACYCAVVSAERLRSPHHHVRQSNIRSPRAKTPKTNMACTGWHGTAWRGSGGGGGAAVGGAGRI